MTSAQRLITLTIRALFLAFNTAIAAKVAWNCFIPKVFGLPAVDTPTMIAMTITLAILFSGSSSESKTDGKDLNWFVQDALATFVAIWVAVGFVVLASKFIGV